MLRECRFYTAGCGNKMTVSVTGPRTVNELGVLVIPGRGSPQITKILPELKLIFQTKSHLKDVLHLFLASLVKDNIFAYLTW